MAVYLEGSDVPLFDGDGNFDTELAELAGKEVRMTLEIEGVKYGARFFLRPGFPEVYEQEDLMLSLHALYLAQIAGQTFLGHFESQGAEVVDDGTA